MTKVGVVGYSDDKVFNQDIAKALLAIALDIVEEDFGDKEYSLVSGCSNMGVHKLAYELADKREWETVCFSAEEVKQYDCYDTDKEIYFGEKFGDESEEFIKYIDCLVRIGAGKQSLDETEMAKEADVPVYEYDLPLIDEYIENFSRKLQKYNIIHSSGLVLVDGEIYLECYLDLSLNDDEYKDLKIFLDKNKSKFKDIKIEELSLSKSKVNLNGYMEN